MSNSTNSAPAPTKFPPWLQRILDALDPDFPAVIVGPGPAGGIDDPALYGNETLKPDFVRADDVNFMGGAK